MVFILGFFFFFGFIWKLQTGIRGRRERSEIIEEEKRDRSTQKGNQMKVHYIQEEDSTAKPVTLQFCTLHINMNIKFKSVVIENDDSPYSGVLEHYKIGSDTSLGSRKSL